MTKILTNNKIKKYKIQANLTNNQRKILHQATRPRTLLLNKKINKQLHNSKKLKKVAMMILNSNLKNVKKIKIHNKMKTLMLNLDNFEK